MTRSGELLHQAGGALRMTETYGAALLVEEMELVAAQFNEQVRAYKAASE